MLEFEPWLATMPLKHGTKTARLMCQVPIKYQPSVAFYPIFSVVNIQIKVHFCTKLMRKILYLIFRAVVVAQLVERLLPIPEVRGSNPVIGKNLFTLNICLLSTVY